MGDAPTLFTRQVRASVLGRLYPDRIEGHIQAVGPWP
jgi:hypothetical protein